MASSLNIFFSPVATVKTSTTTSRRGRVYMSATSAKSSGGGSEEKSILDWVLGGMQKEDQLVETDPILNKVEEKVGTTTGTRKGTVSIQAPPKKKDGGGFLGGLFAK